jgi:hypothetical protein
MDSRGKVLVGDIYFSRFMNRYFIVTQINKQLDFVRIEFINDSQIGTFFERTIKEGCQLVSRVN